MIQFRRTIGVALTPFLSLWYLEQFGSFIAWLVSEFVLSMVRNCKNATWMSNYLHRQPFIVVLCAKNINEDA